MEQIIILARFIHQMVEVPVEIWERGKRDFRLLARQHCFSATVQPLLRATSLQYIAEHIHPHCVTEMWDALGLRLILFAFDGHLLAVGPFVEDEWVDSEGMATLAKVSLSASDLVSYKLYYNRYRVADKELVLRAIQSGIDALVIGGKPYTHHVVCKSEQPLDFEETESSAEGIQSIVERYEIENKFVRHVQAGDAQAALVAWDGLNAPSNRQPYMSRDIKAMIASATVLRTLVRKATESAGVHPAIVDAISSGYAQRTYAATHENDLASLFPQMVYEFCEAVRQVKQENYSQQVRRAADYIQLQLSKTLSLVEIACHIGLSTDHLSHLFKQETGMSVLQYSAKKKCEKAAELLRYTNLHVQDIAAYVGYEDNNYFVKVFKKQYGMTPSAYRE